MTTAYDRLQRRKYWRAMDMVEMISRILLALIILGVFAYCIWYSVQTQILYGANAPLITL